MPIINVSLVAGRSSRTKDDFAKAVTEAAAEHLSVSPAQVRVLFFEVEADGWFVAGQSKASSG